MSRDYNDGIVINYGTLPGGTVSRYNLGDTLVHESGCAAVECDGLAPFGCYCDADCDAAGDCCADTGSSCN